MLKECGPKAGQRGQVSGHPGAGATRGDSIWIAEAPVQGSQLGGWLLTRILPCTVLPSSIMNVPGESTLRREFLRLQQENKSNSEALKQQQQQLQQQQQRDPEAHIKHLLHQRQRRIEEQKEERRRVEEVWSEAGRGAGPSGRA